MQEAERATELLRGKVVRKIWRHSQEQIGIEFTDGTRVFVDRQAEGLEISVTSTGDRGSES